MAKQNDNSGEASSVESYGRYEGYTVDVENSVQKLARQITNQSHVSFEKPVPTDDSSDLMDTISKVSSIAPGVIPINNPEMDSKLDPSSENFNSRYWIKNFRSLMDKDPEYYKNYSMGISYKELRAYGTATDADYQSTVLNAPYKIASEVYRKLFSSPEKKKATQFDILKPMEAIIRPGEVVVVLGRPGSGCSTLLKTIAAQTHGFHVGQESEISYEGLTQNDIKHHYRGEVIYSAESDIHFPHLTVGETLTTAAKFRTPQNRIPGVSREDYAKALTDVYMATYGLSHTKNTKVGSELVRGVSGGERKRVSIAEVSLAGAKIQCWDNATRGLDAATALEFIKALRTSADVLDTTALIAIYQCSQDAYDLFDKVSVLYEGYQIFFGRGDAAKDYFERMGWDCPARQTTADFLTSVTSPRERVPKKGFESSIPRTPKEFNDYWRKSPEYAQLINEIDASLNSTETSEAKEHVKNAHNAKQSKRMRPASSFTVSYWMQTKYLVTREYQRIWNDLGFHMFQSIANGLMSLILASIFYNMSSNTGSFTTRGSCMFFACLFNSFSSLLEIMSLFESRPIVEKHKQFSLYHASAAQLASVISQVPFKLFTAVMFNLIYYFMVNFRREPGAFFFYFLVNITATFAMSHIFRLTGAATKTLSEALVPASLILNALSIFVGFTIPVNYMLGWSRWINYINPLGYAFEALMINEFHGRQFDCSSFLPESPFDNPDLPSDAFICNAVSAVAGSYTVDGTKYLYSAYKYKHSHKWRNWGITLVFAVFFLGVYLLFAEYNESAKQKGEVILFQQSTLRKLKKQHGDLKNDLEAGSEKEITEQEASEDQDSDAIQGGKDIFHWRDVHYTVKIKSEHREILQGVDGWVKPGTLTALMGASGAGKTTLLDVLASRVTMGVVTGNMFVNGRLRDSSFQRSTGYVQQQDLHLSTATVREALKFSAYLRQPSSVSKAEKDSYVEEVIKLLDMEKYADAVVGVAGEGLNVEQRKRLTIGVELAAKPKLLLFLDEPTSGLDSQTAWSICQLMRKLANHGQAILCTIHQPSAILMQEFDRLLFLARGGRTIYFGDLGKNCQTLIDYFEAHGSPKCPPSANPAEWMLHVIGAAPGSHANQDYHEVWLNSKERKAVLDELDEMERELVKIPYDNTVGHEEFAAPIPLQIYLVTKRVLEQYWRSPDYLWSKIFLAVSSALFVGFSFFHAKTTIQGMTNQLFGLFMFTTVFNPLLQQILPSFVSQRDLYETRERPSKTFSWKAFIASQMLAEAPWNLFVGTLSFFCFYYPPAFYNNASPNGTAEVNSRGAYAWFLCVLFFIYIGTMAHLCIAPFQIADSAGNIGSLMFTLCLVFCGVMVQPKALPGFWIFMYRVSPLTYFIDGFLSNALAHNKITCADNEWSYVNTIDNQTCSEYFASYIQKAGTGYLENPDATSDCKFCSVSTTDDFLKSVSLSYSRKWRNVGIFIAYIFINIAGATLLYYLARVPKKSMKVKKEERAKKSEQSN